MPRKYAGKVWQIIVSRRETIENKGREHREARTSRKICQAGGNRRLSAVGPLLQPRIRKRGAFDVRVSAKQIGLSLWGTRANSCLLFLVLASNSLQHEVQFLRCLVANMTWRSGSPFDSEQGGNPMFFEYRFRQVAERQCDGLQNRSTPV